MKEEKTGKEDSIKHHTQVRSTLFESDNGPAFISWLTQSLIQVLGNNWKLHCVQIPEFKTGREDELDPERGFGQINP